MVKKNNCLKKKQIKRNLIVALINSYCGSSKGETNNDELKSMKKQGQANAADNNDGSKEIFNMYKNYLIPQINNYF